MTHSLRGFGRTLLYLSVPSVAGVGTCYAFYTEAARRKEASASAAAAAVDTPRRTSSRAFVAGNAFGELCAHSGPPSWWSTLHRWLRLVWRSFKLGVGLTILASTCAMQGIGLLSEDTIYDAMVWVCTQLGPTYIKLGQWVASRPDAFPVRLCDKMAMLFDHSPPHPWECTLKRLQGTPALEALRSVDRTPVNVGSVAQVHRATLHESVDGVPAGTPLALKVLHPDVHELVYLDVTALRIAARVLQALIPSLEYIDVRTNADEFAALLSSQLNLKREAENLAEFRHHFRATKGVTFPTPLPSLCTPDVLVETFEVGLPLQRVPPCKKLAEIGVRMFFKMVFEDNFLHADLHPGNILVRSRHADGTVTATPPSDGVSPELVVLDAGLTTSLRPRDRENLIALLAATLSGDGALGARLMVERSPCNRCTDVPGYVKEMQRIFDVAHPRNGSVFLLSMHDIGSLLTDVMHTTRRFRVGIEGSFTSVIATVILGEGLVHRLHPEMNVCREVVPYLCRALSGHELAHVARALRESYDAEAPAAT